jgi:hypothetical protein
MLLGPVEPDVTNQAKQPARSPIWVTAAIVTAVALIGLGAIVLPPAGLILLGGLLALAGVAVFTGPRIRTGFLVLASVLLSFAAAEAFIGVLAEPPVNRSVAKTHAPNSWTVSDEIVGYRTRPGIAVEATATYGDEPVYRQTYTIEPSGARRTPGSAKAGPTYLFVGDSYVFGEGLADEQTVAARFAAGLRSPANVVNLGVVGYSPAHLVRAIESGLYDREVVGKVAAVVTWITRIHLPRLTGDGGWLGSSPHYELDSQGKARFTGSFNEYRWTHPAAGMEYLGRTYLASVARATRGDLERAQVPLYIALLAELRDKVRARYNAPLVLIYDWPEAIGEGLDDPYYVPWFKDIKALGTPMVSVRSIIGSSMAGWNAWVIPHDNHPNARLTDSLAKELLKVLGP